MTISTRLFVLAMNAIVLAEARELGILMGLQSGVLVASKCLRTGATHRLLTHGVLLQLVPALVHV